MLPYEAIVLFLSLFFLFSLTTQQRIKNPATTTTRMKRRRKKGTNQKKQNLVAFNNFLSFLLLLLLVDHCRLLFALFIVFHCSLSIVHCSLFEENHTMDDFFRMLGAGARFDRRKNPQPMALFQVCQPICLWIIHSMTICC